MRTALSRLESLQAHPFSLEAVSQAQQEFVAAQTNIGKIQAGLAPLEGVGSLVPVYGSRLVSAIRLTSLAVDVSRAGISGCKILEILLARLHDPLNAGGSALTFADYTTINSDYQEAQTALNAAMYVAQQLKPGDVAFDARLEKLLQEFQDKIPTLRVSLAELDQLLPSLPSILGIGAPAHYLLEVLDSSELRPAGGFIGNYGILTLAGGRPLPVHITDVDLLDKPYKFSGRTIPYPPAYRWFTQYLASQSWSLRDSNLDADFPTAARYGEQNFEREGGNVPLQGVIAVTPYLIQQALDITGSVSVPEYHETITAQNLVERIHYHQLGDAGEGPDYTPSPDGYSSLRKHFTALLAEHMLARIRQLPASAQSSFVALFAHALQSKDVQVYLNASAAENILLQYHLAGAIQSPPGDGLFIVDANVGRDKANSFITSTINDQVTIDSSGDAIHHAVLEYSWKQKGNIYGSPLYKDYVRVYVPSDSVLLSQQGWQIAGASAAFDRKVWAGSFTLVYGQSVTITLIWRVPGAAKLVAHNWQYGYLLQRQAGKVEAITLQIALPHGTVLAGKTTGLKSSSQSLLLLAPDVALTSDLNIKVEYRS
ncbi:MAG TPA: DUF4012 domain-containing protein [Ktedonobacteraceae bacterium]|nr:DUF4012 domain-containing protein [Ktedonobacteraceae bacterium]